MITKILGLLDIIVALSFWLFGVFGFIPEKFILIIGLFLLVKGIIFITGLSITSFLDIISSLVIISATSLEMPLFVIILVSLFLLQKGIFSLLG